MVKEGTQNVNEHGMRASREFKEAVDKMMKTLITNFIKNGSKDCEHNRIVSMDSNLLKSQLSLAGTVTHGRVCLEASPFNCSF